MSLGLVIADATRAGDHAAVLGVLVLIAAVGGLIYGLARLVAKSRADRTRSDHSPENDRAPKAPRSGRGPDGARGPGA
jgi:hypothetical protein